MILVSLESDLQGQVFKDEEDTLASGKRKPLRPGRALPLKTFLQSMRSRLLSALPCRSQVSKEAETAGGGVRARPRRKSSGSLF